MTVLDQILLLVFPVALAYAAASDLLTMRISNRLVLVMLAGFCIAAVVMGMPLRELGIHVAAGTGVLFVSFAFFAFGWIGGGDAKLAAVTGLWLGWPLVLEFLLRGALFGGLLTLLILLLRRVPIPAPLQRQAWIDRLHDHRSGIPYGVALALAGMLVYPSTAIFAHFAG